MSNMPTIYMMPLPPDQGGFAHKCYMKFMRHLNHIKGREMDQRILSAIQFTADMTDNSTAAIARMLVEMGLRAPKSAFPEDYLDYIRESRDKPVWMLGALNNSQQDLIKFWERENDQLNRAIDRSAKQREQNLQDLVAL